MGKRAQRSKRGKRTPDAPVAMVCLSPYKKRHTLRVAQRIAAERGCHVYPCGDHYHLTRKSIGAP